MPKMKDHRVFSHAVSTYRDLEDWREERTVEKRGSWAVHCLDHNQREFFTSYDEARLAITSSAVCPDCLAFDTHRYNGEIKPVKIPTNQVDISTLAAWGPLGPCTISNSTTCPSCKVR